MFSRFNQFRVKDGEVQLWIQSYPNYIGLLNVNKSIEAGETVFDHKYTFISSFNKNLLAESNIVFNLDDSTFLLTKDPIRSQTFENNTNPFYVKLNYGTNELSDTIYMNANLLYFSVNEKNKVLYGIDAEDRILVYSLNDIICVDN